MSSASNRGSEPRLHYGLGRGHVVARDPQNGKILIGGLGGMGLGRMWSNETEDDKTRDGYEEAPVQMWPGDWWE